MNALQSDRKSRDSFSLSIRVVLYLSKESHTPCNPFTSSCARICFKLNGAHGRSSFIAADTPENPEKASQAQQLKVIKSNIARSV